MIGHRCQPDDTLRKAFAHTLAHRAGFQCACVERVRYNFVLLVRIDKTAKL